MNSWKPATGFLSRQRGMLVRARHYRPFGPCKVPHEIGSRSGKHVQFGDIAASEAQEGLDFARDVHQANALPFKSFIFPREAVGHLDALARAGLRTFRGPDVGCWSGPSCAKERSSHAESPTKIPGRGLSDSVGSIVSFWPVVVNFLVVVFDHLFNRAVSHDPKKSRFSNELLLRFVSPCVRQYAI
jgi:hypothetical protein